MGLFKSIFKEVVDVVDVGIAVTKDIAKAPARLVGGDGIFVHEEEEFLHDTKEALKEDNEND